MILSLISWANSWVSEKVTEMNSCIYSQFFLILIVRIYLSLFIFCWWTLGLFSDFGYYKLCCCEHSCINLLMSVNIYFCQVDPQKQTCWVIWYVFLALLDTLSFPKWLCQFIPLMAILYESFRGAASLPTIVIICLHFYHSRRH